MNTVELTPETRELLSNFSTLNSNIFLRTDGKLLTKSVTEAPMAQARIEEKFPASFGIFDLPLFLNVLSSFAEPKLTFSEKQTKDETSEYVIVSGTKGEGSFRFYGSSKINLVFPRDEANLKQEKVTFDVEKSALIKTLKMSTIAGLNDIIFEGNSEGIFLKAAEKESMLNANEITNRNESKVQISDEAQDNDFSIVLDPNDLKLVVGDYEVSFDGRAVAKFKHKERDLTYFVAVKKTSNYSE